MEWHDCFHPQSILPSWCCRSYYVFSSALICRIYLSTSRRCKKEKSSFTPGCGCFACCLHSCYHGIYCIINLYRNAISLCASKATLCYARLVRIAIQICHVPEPNRSGAVKRLV